MRGEGGGGGIVSFLGTADYAGVISNLEMSAVLSCQTRSASRSRADLFRLEQRMEGKSRECREFPKVVVAAVRYVCRLKSAVVLQVPGELWPAPLGVAHPMLFSKLRRIWADNAVPDERR